MNTKKSTKVWGIVRDGFICGYTVKPLPPRKRRELGIEYLVIEKTPSGVQLIRSPKK